jgi:phosphoglycolate phosphatase-like HAD superfamily hydrolase
VDRACGDARDGLVPTKTELVGRLVRIHGLGGPSTWIVGDMSSDIQAGHAHGLTTVAARYGYGDPSELLAAAPTLCVGDVAELAHRIDHPAAG